MGNHRFKLSHMMPNAWFYKLRDMSRATTDHPNNKNSSFPPTKNVHRYHPPASKPVGPPDVCTRKSYYFPREHSPRLPDPPRRPSKQARPPRKSKPPDPAAQSPPMKPVSSSASFGHRASTDSVWTRTEDAGSPDSIYDSSSPEFRLDQVLTSESLGSCSSKSTVDPAVDDPDIVIHLDENSFTRKPMGAIGSHNFDSLPKFELPRIVTKPAKPKNNYNADHIELEAGDRETEKWATKVRYSGSSRKSTSRRCPVSSSPRLRLKIKSPRLPSRRPAQARRKPIGTDRAESPSGRKKLSGSLAIVKSSSDPQRDFRESMVEMIVEHNIKASKDLEDLLACYLSLNSDEYHELIIEVFKQIWFDLTHISALQVS